MAEKLQHIIYLILVFITLIALSAGPFQSHIIGLIVVFFSLFTLFRLISLYVLTVKKEQASLPKKLLTTFDSDQEKQNGFLKKRISAPDLSIWLGFVVLFVVWIIICTLFPSELKAIKTVHLEFSEFLGNFYQGEQDYKTGLLITILPIALLFFLLVLSTFTSFSFADSKRFIRKVYIAFIPVFAILMVFTALTSGLVGLFIWPDAQFWKGGGIDTARKIFLLHSDIALDSGSFFLARFIETGFIGSYLFYLIIFPAMVCFFQVLTVKRRRVVTATVGFSVIALMIMVDLFWIYTPFVNALFFAGWIIVACSWAQCGFKTQHLKR